MSTPAGNRSVLLLYGATHGLVDTACAALVFGLAWSQQFSGNDYLLLVIGYNALAFALQPLFGLIADKVRRPSATAALGTALTGVGVALSANHTVLAVCFAGVGNAIFHVGGGAVALTMMPNRSSAPGLFVAPGALGIAIGAIIGGNGPITAWPFLILLAVAATTVVSVKTQARDTLPQQKPMIVRWPLFIGALLLLSVAIRSLVSFGAAAPWGDHKQVLFLIACAAFSGKALGGIVADRYGWLGTATSALLVSAPLLAFGAHYPAFTLIGMFLFQMTMPVTLAALFMLLPGRPSFAFGLTCLALIAGAAPFFTQVKSSLSSGIVIFPAILAAAGALFIALRMLLPVIEPRTSSLNVTFRENESFNTMDHPEFKLHSL